MATAEQFGADIIAYGEAVEAGMARAVNEYSLRLYDALISAKHTSERNEDVIFTGYSRSRWQLRFGTANIPNVDPPPKVYKKYYYMKPDLPSPRTSRKLVSSVITNDASYIEEIDGPHFITLQARAKTLGLFDSLLERYAPK